MSTFVLMYFFVLLYFFCSEMAAGGQDLLACKIWGFYLEKWLSYWTRYERGHLVVYLSTVPWLSIRGVLNSRIRLFRAFLWLHFFLVNKTYPIIRAVHSHKSRFSLLAT